MKSGMNVLAVLGAGSWGTALAMLAARQGHTVFLWDRNSKHIDSLRKEHSNIRYLPDFQLSRKIIPVSDFSCLTETKNFIIAVPSHAFRATLISLRNNLPKIDQSWRFCWGTKGLEVETGKLLSEVFEEVIGQSATRGAVSGPSFAKEVAKELPTAMTIAAHDKSEAHHLASWFRNNRTRIYTTNDLTGVQLGGAIKNVIAIATGISDGLGFGVNARSAIITRGLAEMVRLGIALGGQTETFMGLAGIGDLVLTCTDNQSRNRRVGIAIGEGKTLTKALNQISQETEGVDSARAIFEISNKLSVDAPITEQVCRVLFNGVAPKIAVQSLLDREPRPENS